jgi:GNAT superfamily N-acetyltransferase
VPLDRAGAERGGHRIGDVRSVPVAEGASPVAPGWVVRQATAADSAALADLRWAWRAVERSEVGLPRPEFVAQFERWFLEHRGSHFAFLAQAGSLAVGMAWLAMIERVPGPGTWTRLAGHLQSVYVLPAYRNDGVGAALVTAALGKASESDFDYVVVHPSARSFPLYRRLGFRETEAVLEVDLRAHRSPS